MQKLLFCSFTREVQNFFGVVWHPFCPSLPCCFAVRESKFFPWRQEVEAVAKTHAKASFLQFQEGRSALSWCCLAPILSFTATLFCCSGGYVFPMATQVRRNSSKNSCKSFFSTVSEGTFKTFSVLFGTRFVLHCHAALPFGRVSFSHGDKR